MKQHALSLNKMISGLMLSISVGSASGAEPTLPDMELMLEIVVNGRPSGQIAPVRYQQGHYYVSPAILKEVGLPLSSPDTEQQDIAVDTLKNIHVDYDSSVQQLLLNVPNDWLPKQFIDANDNYEKTQAYSHFGLLMNYDIYTSQTDAKGHNRTFSLYSEQRMFSPFGIISNQGIYQNNSGSDDQTNNRYLRYDTNWRYNDETHMLKYVIGDLATHSLSWSNSVRLGGIQIGRNFSTQPNLITYPLPQFAGQAAVPSAVDLYINSYKTSQTNVDPGPFTINTVPYINGAGEATVVVTDPLGREVTTSVPFYVASDLLKAGLLDFSVSAGAIRRSYAVKSFDYGEFAASSSMRYGLTNWLTLEGHLEGADKLLAGGGGANLRLGWFGVLNGSYSESRAQAGAFINSSGNNRDDVNLDKRNGHQTSIGYSYIHPRFSVNARRTKRSEDFGDLARYKSYYQLSKQTDQVTASLALGKVGVIGAGYFDVRQHNGDRLRLANLSYSVSLWRSIHLYSSVNREIGEQGYSGQIILSMPLDSLSNVSLSASRNNQRDWLYTGSYSKAVPLEGGLGWDVTYSDGDQRRDPYAQFSMTMRNPHLQGQLGVYGERDFTYWGELTGSLVFMDKQFYATNTIHDSFVLVSTDGYENIPILFENQLIGKTDKNGYVLIPSVSSYYQASYQIDPLAFSSDIQLPDVQQRVMVKEGSGYTLRFPISKLSAVNTRLLDEHGQPMPVGSAVRLNNGSNVSYVGWDGQLYLENVKTNNALVVIKAGDRRECRAAFSLTKTDNLQSVPPLTCVEDKNGTL